MYGVHVYVLDLYIEPMGTGEPVVLCIEPMVCMCMYWIESLC